MDHSSRFLQRGMRSAIFGTAGLGALFLTLGLPSGAKADPGDATTSWSWHQDSRATSRYSGVVTRRLANGQFELRTDDGHLILVDTRGNGQTPNPGDRIGVGGYFDDHTLVVTDLNFVNRGDNPYGTSSGGQYVRIDGTMTHNLRHDNFEFRASNGALLAVEPQGHRPPHLKAGDQIEVSGTLSDNFLVADQVVITFDKHGHYFIDFPGTVIDLINGHHFKVHGDNGRDFLIESSSRLDKRMHSGDRVRVVGDFDGKTILATEVHVLDAYSLPLHEHDFIFRGTVINVFPDNDLQVRSEHGDMYSVRVEGAGYFSIGQRVRVVGRLSDGKVLASKVTSLGL